VNGATSSFIFADLNGTIDAWRSTLVPNTSPVRAHQQRAGTRRIARSRGIRSAQARSSEPGLACASSPTA
jgi:hypothetical protein